MGDALSCEPTAGAVVAPAPSALGVRGPRWVLSYLRRPIRPWAIWQVGGYANVDGIDGAADLDVMAAAGS